MKQCKFVLRWWVLSVAIIVVGCGMMDEPKPKNAPFGLITTPPTYYSTSKARYLGDRYKANLDRLVERIVRDPKTASLQFANNIASVGGIGFFTHSAATTPDERYLEIVLAAPETFETNGDPSGKLNQLFGSYGLELLSILASDSEIYQEKDVAGYGLNLSWRKVVREPSGPRVTLERAVAYFPKQKVRGFLRQELSQNDLLHEAVIFSVEEDGPMKLVTYTPVESKPDFRPPIQEQTLAATPLVPKAEGKSGGSGSPTPSTAQSVQTAKKAAGSKIEQPSIEETFAGASKPPRTEGQELVGPASAAREEKISSNSVGDKSASEDTKADVVTERSAVKQSQVSNALKQVQESPAQTDSPKIEVSPARPSATKTTEPVSIVGLPKDKVVTSQMTAKPELPGDRSNEPTPKPVATAKENEATVKERATPDRPFTKSEPTAAAPAKKVEAVDERPARPSPAPIEDIQTVETPAAKPGNEPLSPTALQSPGLRIEQPKQEEITEIQSKPAAVVEANAKKEAGLETSVNENTTGSKIDAPKTDTKPSTGLPVAASKVAESNESKLSDVAASLTKEANSSSAKMTKAFVEKVPERVVVAPEPETKAAAVTQFFSGKANPTNVADVPAENPAEAKNEGLTPIVEQPKVAYEKPSVSLQPRVKTEAETQPLPTELSQPIGQTGSKGDAANTENIATEIISVPVPIDPVESKKTKPSVTAAAPKPDPVQKPDTLESMQKEKREVAVAAAKKAAGASEITAQHEIGAQEKKESGAKSAVSAEQSTAGVLPSVAKSAIKAPPIVPMAPEPAPAVQAQVPEAKEQVASLVQKPTETSTRELPAPLNEAEVRKPEVASVPASPAPVKQATVPEKPANEQIALLTKKPAEIIPEKKAIPRPAPKALEGYIIQLSFSERTEAQRWAENLTAQGYAVSMTEAGSNAFRVRIGNFGVRSDAEKRLKTLGQQGLKGIVLNLPQAYRPDTNHSAEATADVISVTP